MPKFNDAFRKWFGRSVVTIGGKPGGEPLIVYHGSKRKFESFDLLFSSQEEPGFFFTDDLSVARAFAGSNGYVVAAYIRIEDPLVEDFGGESYSENVMFDMFDQSAADNHDGFIMDNIKEHLGDYEYISDQYCVFSPTQIKAVDNDGTWDPNDPNIYRNPENLHFLEECTGSHDQQLDLVLYAYLGKKPVGSIEHVRFQNKIYISMIFVDPYYRRRGIATALWAELKRVNKGRRIVIGDKTDDGKKFFRSLKRKDG